MSYNLKRIIPRTLSGRDSKSGGSDDCLHCTSGRSGKHPNRLAAPLRSGMFKPNPKGRVKPEMHTFHQTPCFYGKHHPYDGLQGLMECLELVC